MYRRWLIQVNQPTDLRRDSSAAAPAEDAIDPPALPAVALPAIADDADGAAGGCDVEAGAADDAAVAGDAAAESAGAASAEPADQQQKHAEHHARNRGIAAAWVESGTVLRGLVLLRAAMEPSMVVLRRQLHNASARWSTQQEAASLAAGNTASRDYRLLAAARGDLDTALAQHQAQLCSSPVLLSLVPCGLKTEEARCLAFRMNSQIHAASERIMAFRHRRPPYLCSSNAPAHGGGHPERDVYLFALPSRCLHESSHVRVRPCK